ncbi:MAG TPA: EF-hand domain-containing protein [Candidatus Krumholzibacteria bacterium]|nr:EF-hand domain-containing protein [Candidatus Krumholzibacteria bacterium]
MISSIGGMTQTMMMRPPQGEPPAPEEMFSELDVDGSGTLDETEHQAMIERMEAHHPHGDETREAPDAATMLSDLDTDGDGALSLEELEAGRPAGPPPPRGGEEAVAASASDAEASLREQLLALFELSDDTTSTGVLV